MPATFSAASDAIDFVTCEYVSRVTAVELFPRRSATTFGCSPARSASVAHVCRRSCRRKRERDVRVQSVVGGLLAVELPAEAFRVEAAAVRQGEHEVVRAIAGTNLQPFLGLSGPLLTEHCDRHRVECYLS